MYMYADTETIANMHFRKVFLMERCDWVKVSQKIKFNVLIPNMKLFFVSLKLELNYQLGKLKNGANVTVKSLYFCSSSRESKKNFRFGIGISTLNVIFHNVSSKTPFQSILAIVSMSAYIPDAYDKMTVTEKKKKIGFNQYEKDVTTM